MKTRTLVALTVLVLSLTAGCGSDDPTSAPGGGGTSAIGPSTSSSADLGDDARAVSVTYRKTGGLKPSDERLVYTANAAPPAGTTRAELDQILATASDPALQKVDLTPMPSNTCCDRQEYDVTVTYADGSSTSFRTLDGLQQPQVFENLLSMLG